FGIHLLGKIHRTLNVSEENRYPLALAFERFSARCFGVYARGSGREAGPPLTIGWPHALQNFADDGRSAPQWVQRNAKLVPHSRQKREPSGFALLQEGQFKARAPSRLLPRGSARRFQ